MLRSLFARAARATVAPAALAAVISLHADPSSAEPYLAVGKGKKCSACHVNGTGGGGRTRYGATFGATTLPRRAWPRTPRAEGLQRFLATGDAGPFRLGGDFEFKNETFREDPGHHVTNELGWEDARVYASWEAVPDRLSLYLDERVAPGGAASREALLLFTGLPHGGWVKAGRGYLPFGLRLDDDDAWTRRATGFSMDNVDDMVEVGFEPGKWSFVGSISNGTSGGGDPDSRKQVTVMAQRTGERFTLGVSGAHNNGDAGDRTAAAVHGGVNVGSVSVLAEADQVWDDDDATGVSSRTRAYLVESRWWFRPGMNFRLSWDLIDPDPRIVENSRNRVGLGWSGFLYPNLLLHAGVTARDAPPQEPSFRGDSAEVALHFYF